MFTNPFANILSGQAPAPQATPAAAPAPVAQPTPAPSGGAQLEGAAPTPANTPLQTPGTAPNGVIPAGEETPPSPLDSFKDLWQNDPNVKPQGEYTPQVLDPAKLQEVVAKTNMTSAITPEIQARINAGGEDANLALNEAMNLVAQQALMQSTTVANKMIESNSEQMMAAMIAKLPSLVKSQNLANNLHDQNPIFKNPAVAPVIDAVTSQLQSKFPAASAPELTIMAQDFVKTMSEALNPAAPTPSPLDAELDWSGFENS